MAGRFRRYWNNRGTYRAKASARYKRYGGAKGIAGMSLPYIGGAALGYFGDQVLGGNTNLIDNVAIAAVALPGNIGGRSLGPVRNVGRGYLIGRLLKSLIANKLNPAATITSDVI